MNHKSSFIFRIIAGAYLVYQGVSLLTKVLKDRPENLLLFVIISVIFIVVGGIFFVVTAKDYIKSEREEIEIKSYQEEEPAADAAAVELDGADGEEKESCE